MKFGIGQPVRRVEDQRLITGQGRYTDDINLPGQVYGYVLRSPVAHARITRLDASAAKAAPGVLLVLTGDELDASIPCLIPIRNRDGTGRADPKHPILCKDEVNYVGDYVAFVVAETREQAKDAAELIEVEYDELPAVADTAKALAAGAAQVHPEAPGNLAFDWHFGDEAAVQAAFAKAARVVKLELVNNRVICNAMEPRACVAEYDPAADKLTVHTCTQGGWGHRDVLAQNLGMAPEKVRVITPDVGGGFGMKGFFYPEYTMAAFAARALRRPVKWTGERGESFLSDTMGRDHVTVAEIGFDADHRIVGLRVDVVANMGAYYYAYAPYIPTGAALKVLPGVYDVKTLSYGVKGVFTNTVPVDAYRGAGRPESIYCIERLMDYAADELGVDPVELRRKNFIRPEQMPFKTAAGEVYDSGDFARVMDACLEKADWAGIDRRRAEAKARGKLRGIGMCYYIESTMGDPTEHASIRFEQDGTVSVLVGTQSNGQGHETAYAQVLHARLGVPFEQIRIVQGDTDRIKAGGGTGGSRSLTAQGMAIADCSDIVIERGKAYAAQLFETAAADIQFHDGTFRVAGTDRAIGIMELAEKARAMAPIPGMEGGLDADATTKLQAWTFPNGCHIAEVEIDPDTGITQVVNYNIVDDFGVVLNPLLVEGQVHGGIVQGIGQALLEGAVYDESGQLLTGSFMDYTMPRADNMPSFNFSTVEIPCKNNALGVKGCGEAGSVGSPAAVINAIVDALSARGIRHVDMPATPEKIWRLLQMRKAA
ncbi:xanthine dehydrogenase family protein molybdopterin-binding subunit [Benzoatithermus flavus]|uniref:Xanthine dehydrogenase family protein molybdopterin-binding subunit n=1 Tax=Benzoatithermus flavus TaxID=3108223 RepID=A0ABU8XPI4_9PROT